VETSKIIKIVVSALLVIALVLFLHRNLPLTAVVQITGTDIKRVDKSGGKPKSGQENRKGEKVVQTSDVRFINAVSRNGKVMVFRNEDTGWGWPLYFKFNSADLTAQAQAFLNSEEKPWVLVKYYGWRVRIFSMFPNAVSFKEVDKDYTNIPLFNIVFVCVLIILAIFIKRKYKQLIEWARGLKKSSTAQAK
jgi:hypothetical protein